MLRSLFSAEQNSPTALEEVSESAVNDENDQNSSIEGGESMGEPGDESVQKVVQPLSAEALAEFNAAQERAGIVYISRIPPGMRPTKVRHLMSAYGEVGRVYLQQEDPKRAHLRRKHTTTRKAHYTEGWVEFTSKRVARSVAEMLNAQPIGGKKGTRWRDDIWTMKYLPRFKWYMLTEQIAHEAATHTAKLRVELSQSKTEQRDYLRQVELARVLDKRSEAKRKRDANGEALSAGQDQIPSQPTGKLELRDHQHRTKKPKISDDYPICNLDGLLNNIF